MAKTLRDVVINIANYKPCRYKLYDAYLCRPPIGTVIINKFKFPQAYIEMGRRDAFLPSGRIPAEIAKLQQLVSVGMAQLVGRGHVVVAGPRGDLSVMRFTDASCDYTLTVGGFLHEAEFRSDCNPDGTFAWRAVKPSYGLMRSRLAACHVPIKYRGVVQFGDKSFEFNRPGESHGKGDFMLCEVSTKGEYSWLGVVNGEDFALKFNNQGWVDCVSTSICSVTIDMLPQIVKLANREDIKSTSVSKLCDEVSKAVSNGVLVSYEPQDRATVSTVVDQSVYRWLLEKPSYSGLKFAMWVSNRLDGLLVMYRDDTVVVVWSGYALSFTDMTKAKQAIVRFSSLQRPGFLSNFRAAYFTSEDYEALKDYTRQATPFTRALMDKDDHVSFSYWLKCRQLYAMLEQSYVGGVTLFRGMYGFDDDGKVKVGQVIPCKSFTSFSLSFKTAAHFGSTVFMVRLDKKVHGVYANLLSACRIDDQYEVILNPGYGLKVVRKVAESEYDNIVWECELIRSKKFVMDLEEKFSFGNDLTPDSISDGVAKLPVTNPELGKYVMVTSQSSRCVKFVSKLVVRDYADVPFFVYIGGSGDEEVQKIFLKWREDDKGNIVQTWHKITEKEQDIPIGKDYAETISNIESAILKILPRLAPEAVFTSPTVGFMFLYNITSRFQQEGYQILKQSVPFVDKDSWGKNFRCSVTISGDNDDHISLQFLIVEGEKIKFRAKSEGKSGSREFDADSPTVVDDVYNLVTRTFSLSQHHRVDRAMKLVSKYLGVAISRSTDDGPVTSYLVGNKHLTVGYDGNMITLNNLKQVLYSERLQSIASAICEVVQML